MLILVQTSTNRFQRVYCTRHGQHWVFGYNFNTQNNYQAQRFIFPIELYWWENGIVARTLRHSAQETSKLPKNPMLPGRCSTAKDNVALFEDADIINLEWAGVSCNTRTFRPFSFLVVVRSNLVESRVTVILTKVFWGKALDDRIAVFSKDW